MERDLNAIECTIALIKSCDKNISTYQKFATHKELLIVPNSPKIQKLIKDIGYSDDENPNPIYVSGKSKDAVLSALTKEQEIFKDKHTLKLEEQFNPPKCCGRCIDGLDECVLDRKVAEDAIDNAIDQAS